MSSDPRRRPTVVSPPAKVPRLDGNLAATVVKTEPGTDDGLSSKIMEKLKMLTAKKPELPDLRSLLSAAIGNLGADAGSISQEGKEVLRMVQQNSMTQVKVETMQSMAQVKMEPGVADPRTALRMQPPVAVKMEAGPPPLAPEYEVMSDAELAAFAGPSASMRNAAAPRVLRPLCEDDDDDDESVPHRLPPGFGAIPEDLVLQRERMKEDERLRAIRSTQPCRFGRSCKKRDCPQQHKEGRSIDEQFNPCAFGRRCKRVDCFFDHEEGRIIDTDQTIAMCRLGKMCKRPDCLYIHPADRELSTGDVRACFFCHSSGHIAPDCPQNPESWCYRPPLPALGN